MKRIHKKRSLVVTSGAPLAAASGLSHAGPTSRGSTTHARTSSQAVPGHPGPSSQGISRHGDHFSQAPEGLSSHTSPSHFVTAYHTNYDSDSDSSIQGSCNKFLDKICFPRGHYHRDSYAFITLHIYVLACSSMFSCVTIFCNDTGFILFYSKHYAHTMADCKSLPAPNFQNQKRLFGSKGLPNKRCTAP
ncbi:hypothetical protein EDB19DRAFT_577848 [Suillus lakei]|nr:hypothetical protein EDB19DRAFT_577848 [Suillus lakei]